MPELSIYLTYFAACVAVVIVPGPTVTVIIANSMRHGSKAGLMNVAGTQAGLAIMLMVLAAGLQAIVQSMAHIFDVIKLIGAAYLVWLGAKMLVSRGKLSSPDGAAPQPERSLRSFFWQGVLVIWSNPKALFFFGAFIPQFVNPDGPVVFQTLLFGATFMVVATVLDGTYAVLAGGAGRLLTKRRIRVLEIFSGCCLVGGGVWLALARR